MNAKKVRISVDSDVKMTKARLNVADISISESELANKDNNSIIFVHMAGL